MYFSSFAPPLTIVASVMLLGYNVMQFSHARMQVVDQMSAYRSFIREQQVGLRILRRLNLRVLLGLIGVYLLLLILSGFTWWVLLLALGKSLLSAWVSDAFHVRAIISKKVPDSLLWLRRIDAIGNSLLLSMVLYLVVFV